jgi:DNA-binding HxlR family transcriptional regulator
MEILDVGTHVSTLAHINIHTKCERKKVKPRIIVKLTDIGKRMVSAMDGDWIKESVDRFKENEEE